MEAQQQTLSMITYNIHKGFAMGRVRFMLPKMRQAIAEWNPDVLFLQEVQGEHWRREKRIEAWPQEPQFEYIAQNIWPHVIYAKNAVYDSGHHGNALLSKHPLDSAENINLSNINRASRSILHAQLQLNGPTPTKIHLLCVHFGLLNTTKKEQCKALMMRIRESVPENEPLLMGGDFNDWRLLLSKPLAEELGIEEAFLTLEGQHARSFPALRPAFCVDRIYFRGMRPLDVQCLQGKPWRMLSDHIPLFARFAL